LLLGAAWRINSTSLSLFVSWKVVALNTSIEAAEMVAKAVHNLKRFRLKFDSFAAALCEHDMRFGGEAGTTTA
jgi:hypothetical protein